MASHEELIEELPKLEKMSNAARLKLAKKRRQKQLRKYTETIRAERKTSSSSAVSPTALGRRALAKIQFVDGALLHDAVVRNDTGEVRRLLERGVCPNLCNADGLTPLHRCCIENTVSLAEILIDHKADLDAKDIEGWTPLHAAAACGNLQMINLLLNSNASLVTVNHDDKMPIDVACDSDIQYVIQQKMFEEGYTDDVCKIIRASVPKNMMADIKDSIKNNRSVNLQDKYGATALHVAAANGYMEVLELLLEQDGTDLNIQDTEGWTPFHAAVCWEQTGAMHLLAQKGADLEVEDIHGDTPFRVSDSPQIRQLILDLKEDHTTPRHEPLVSIDVTKLEKTDSFDDLIELGGRTRSMSVRRTSQIDKNDLKRLNALTEKKILQQQMEAQDVDRTVSGDISTSDNVARFSVLSDDSIVMPLEEQPSTNNTSTEKQSLILETNLTNDDEMSNDMVGEESVFKNRRRELRSVLKNKNPTPRLDNLDTTVKRESSVRQHSGASGARECCTIL